MARPVQSSETRRHLLEEGVNQFLHQGYHGTGLKGVLDELKVPKGSFYNYFESKEAFAVEAIRHYSRCFNERMDEAMEAAPDPLSGLHRFFAGLMESFRDAGYVGGCLIWNLGAELEGSDTCREALFQGFRSWRDRVSRALGEAQALGLVRSDIPSEELADLLTEAWEGAVIRMKIERSLDPLQRVLDRLLDDYMRP